MALSAITVEHTKATVKTMGRCIQLLDYLASNSEAKIRYYASDMVMYISTPIHLTFQNPKHAAGLVGIFSWDGCQSMESQSK